MKRVCLLLLALLLLAACARPVQAPATASHGPPATDAWTQATWEERHDTMTFLVLPEMAKMFQRFENKPYPDLACVSCHGADAEKIGYRMPAGPPLDPSHLPRKDSPDAREARLAAFMADEVTPSLAEMLGKNDVGCFSCHTKRPRP